MLPEVRVQMFKVQHPILATPQGDKCHMSPSCGKHDNVSVLVLPKSQVQYHRDMKGGFECIHLPS